MQRLRNRVIEYLETAASPDEQRNYQATVPIADVPAEMICQWEDFMGRNGEWLTDCREPLYSVDEQVALQRFNRVWSEVCEQTPHDLPPIAQLIATPIWQRFCDAAAGALAVMQRRGKFPEDEEITEA